MSPLACSRRRFLGNMKNLLIASASAPLLSGCGGKGISLTCDKGLRGGEISLRNSLSYVELSPHEEMRCINCVFFSVSDTGGCGQCKILTGPANPHGHCVSWSEIG